MVIRSSLKSLRAALWLLVLSSSSLSYAQRGALSDRRGSQAEEYSRLAESGSNGSPPKQETSSSDDSNASRRKDQGEAPEVDEPDEQLRDDDDLRGETADETDINNDEADASDDPDLEAMQATLSASSGSDATRSPASDAPPSAASQDGRPAGASDDSGVAPSEIILPKPRGPFAQGRFRVSLGLGWASTDETQWLILGVGGGFFLLDGVELSAATTLWVIGEPFVATLTPGLNYVFHFVPKVKPYLGAFYRHYFVASDYRDTDAVGGRAGVYFMTGASSYFGGGVIYEHFLDEDVFESRDQVYPEITFALAF